MFPAKHSDGKPYTVNYNFCTAFANVLPDSMLISEVFHSNPSDAF